MEEEETDVVVHCSWRLGAGSVLTDGENRRSWRLSQDEEPATGTRSNDAFAHVDLRFLARRSY